jgi:HAD superfamily hydrolase (TIGR01509 family)
LTLRALIFDVDGTLADTERDGHRVAYNAAFAEHGLDWDWTPALYGELLAVAGGKERVHAWLARRPDLAPPSDPDTFVARLHATKTRHYTALVRAGAVPLRAGVRRLLIEARAAGLRLAIATTTTPANIDALVETTLGGRTVDWFDVVGAGDAVARKKPAADVYELVLRELGLAPGECLALEDSAQGVAAARGAGVAVLVTENDYTRGQPFEDAVAVLDGLGEPDAPATVRASRLPLPAAVVVDVPLLRALHARAARP